MRIDPQQQLSLDPTAWLEAHGDYLYRYAQARVSDTAIAEDMVQETLLAALQSRGSFGGRASERTWLVGILKHKICDHFRRAARHPEFHPPQADEHEDFDSFENAGWKAGHWRADYAPMDWGADAADLLERKDFWEVFNRCLTSLPARTAAAFRLREIDGLESAEICDILNVSPNNLWVMLHRARKQVRQSIESEWFRGPAKKEGTPATDFQSAKRVSETMSPMTRVSIGCIQMAV